MRLLGLDPGIGITGWGVLDLGSVKPTLVAAGTISTTPNDPTPARLTVLYQSLQQLISTYQPVEAAIERLFFSKNITTAMTVSEARGVLLLALAQHHIPIHEYSPPQVKLSVVGYGNATKRQLMTMLPHHLEGSSLPKQDDSCDAVAIALTHAASRNSKLRTQSSELFEVGR